MGRPRGVEKAVGQEEYEGHVRNLQSHNSHQTGDQDLARPDGRDLKTAENILLAVLHGAHAHAEQTAAEHTQAQHQAYDLLAIAASPAQAECEEEN